MGRGEVRVRFLKGDYERVEPVFYKCWGIWWMYSVRVGFLRGDYEKVEPVVYKGWGIWWMCSVRVESLLRSL